LKLADIFDCTLFCYRAFLTDGCSLEYTTEDVTVCKCNHFTNFAILMSPGTTVSNLQQSVYGYIT